MTDETPSGPANMLLEIDGHDDCEEEACMALSGVDDPDSVDVVFVTFTRSADQRLAAWRDHANAPPANIGIVSVEMGGASGGSGASTARNSGPTVRRISDPSDLTGVGIAISEFLSAWADTDQQTVVCFDSVTALLQSVDANRVFQFLNEMTSKFEQAGVHAHFHLLPEAHETQNLSDLTSLFGERTSAASVVGDDTESLADAADEDDLEGDAGGFVFGAGTDEVDGFVFGDETDGTDADEFVFGAGTDDADADAPDPDEGAEDDGEDESPLIETSDSEDANDDAADLDSVGRSLLDDNDGDETGDEAVERSESDDEGSHVVGPAVGAGPKRKTGAEMGAKQPNDRSATTSSSATMSAAARTATASSPKTPSSSGTTDGEDSEGYRTAIYSRTTATIVGVVVMLVLISFLVAAIPIPMGDDTGADATENT
ncbi:DUF7504 family protein, partial [Natronomonas sp.]|uniref:DUF7504 family protein n=1 Tax=Natronomonas sp. TaxID=2184060 RepID=UPI002FC3C2FD